MKKLLLISVAVATTLSLTAQNRPKLPTNWRNYKVTKSVQRAILEPQSAQNVINSSEKALLPVEAEIGSSSYDLQTNNCVDSRCHLFPDGTVGATWTFGNTSGGYPERGTGYNYFDLTDWTIAVPTTARIENKRTGWPSYAALGTSEEGEVVIAHDGTVLTMSKRALKGTGAWTQSDLPNNAGTNPVWPRICTSGNTIHLLANEYVDIIQSGMHFPLYYYRSQDAGATWDIQQVVPAGLETYTDGFGGDQYAWAKPQGNTIAFVTGSMSTDLVLMKSTDAGTNWTKTVVFQNPHPNFEVSVDTFYTTDETYAVELDPSGNAHVVFGIKRILVNEDTAHYSYFVAVNGIGIWNEGSPAYSGINGLNPDMLDLQGNLVGWAQDRNGDGFLFDDYIDGTTHFSYNRYGGPCSQPQISIDSNGDMYVVYTSACEHMQLNNIYYSHIYGKKYFASSGQWGQIVELLASLDPTDYDQVEMVYPSLSKSMDSQLHLVYMLDLSPGAYVEPADPSAPVMQGSQNSMIYLTIDKSELILNRKEINLTNPTVNVFPNPVANNISVTFTKSSDVVMNIYNSLGALVMSNKFSVNKGDVKDFNISNLSSGIYMVKIQTAEGTYTNKVIKN